jgi:2-polyprenyl-6-methoxyphenol hydroxylase-like FAD-dependent oxidoreductase
MVRFLVDRTAEIRSWDDVKLLTVRVDRLGRWHRPGLLCIGDAAHAMSPVGGVGINLAIQDAVAAARILSSPLREGRLEAADLQAVQDRRMFPTRMTQRAQVLVQERVISPVLQSAWNETGPMPVPPLIMRWMQRYPQLGRIPARLIGVGVRPEHIEEI